MAAQKGRLQVLKLGAAGVGGTLAGVRTTSVKIGVEAVEITNKDSAGWRTLLEGAGTTTVTLSVSGLAATDATFETLQGLAQAGSLNTYQLVDPDTDTLEGSFLITSFEKAGDFNKELTFTATLESSGTITYTNA